MSNLEVAIQMDDPQYLDKETDSTIAIIEEALKRSAATGASVAESNGIGNLENVEDYIKNIRVRKVV